jgi:hypothetical protein
MNSIQPLIDLLAVPAWVVALVLAWSLVWKGLALWRAALLRQKWWFIVLLIVNTLGILEIIYLFVITRHKKVLVEVIEEN